MSEEGHLEIFNYGVLILSQGKRLFIKDIIYYLVPPNGSPSSIAPACARKERGVGTAIPVNGIFNVSNGAPYPYHTEAEPGNPTIIPKTVLNQFHFTFLIRHPRYSIPSFYRCTVPPLDEITGFYEFMPSEGGYDELRRFFDYLRSVGQVGPHVATRETSHGVTNGNRASGSVEICVIDADDLLDSPKIVIEAYCKSVGIEYDEKMLSWGSESHHSQARDAFEKWKGFHDDAINSCDLKPRLHVSVHFYL